VLNVFSARGERQKPWVPGDPLSGNLVKTAASGKREGRRYGRKSTVTFKTETSHRNVNPSVALWIMKRACKIYINQRGFTMIEMVMVLIVMAIMASFIIIRGTTGNDLIAQTEILKSHLRYAQIKAMNDTVPWGLRVPNANSYILYKNNATANDILPGETAQTHTLPATVTVTSGVGTTFNFNEWGTPVDAGGTAIVSPQTITLSQGTTTSSITIKKNTGYIN
jgi:MSHA pilin protein MshC